MPLPPTSSGSGISTSNLQHPPTSHPHLNQDVSDHHNFQAPPPHLQQPPPPHFQPQSHIEHQLQLAQFPLTSPQIEITAQTASVTAPPPAIVTSTPAAVASSNVPNVDPNLNQIVKASAFNVSTSFYFYICAYITICLHLVENIWIKSIQNIDH